MNMRLRETAEASSSAREALKKFSFREFHGVFVRLLRFTAYRCPERLREKKSKKLYVVKSHDSTELLPPCVAA